MNASFRHFRAGAVVTALLVGGCVSEPAVSPHVARMVGPDAKLVAHGKPPLIYQVKDTGKFAVIDQAAGFVLCFGTVQSTNQDLIIDPDQADIVLRGRTNLNQQDVLIENIDPQREY